MKTMLIVVALTLVIGLVPAAAQDPDVTVCEPLIFAQYAAAQGISPVVDVTLCYSPGDDGALPYLYRYKLVEAWLEDPGLWITTKYVYDQSGGGLVAFDSEGWSEWMPWDPASHQTTGFRIEGLDATTPTGERTFYLLAVQVKDENYSRSSELEYADQVHNFYINDAVTPYLTVRERMLGEYAFTGIYTQSGMDVAAGQELNFEWQGTAYAYGGTIASYRWGWDVSDPDDPLDPGWAVSPGLDPVHMSAPPITFSDGIHVLTIDCLDAAGKLTRARWRVSVVPVPDLAERKPLLLIDDVADKMSMGWPDVIGFSRDNDVYRDDFWANTLDAVQGWDASDDVVDTEEDQSWGFREAVQYRTLLWNTRKGMHSYIDNQFYVTPVNRFYVWLEPFMESVGNLFMVGSNAMQSFEPVGDQGRSWLYPVIYDTDESFFQDGATTYARSLGAAEDFDGGSVNVGTTSFPFRSMGLAMTNLAAPSAFRMSESSVGNNVLHVRNRCVGAKALLLAPDFVADNGWAYGIDDTIFTSAVIDHADDPDLLGLNWAFGANDEFYDTNITARETAWIAQTLPDGSPAIEPMWRAYSRYDWILDTQVAAGETDYPGDLDIGSSAYCGTWSVDPATGRTRTDGVPLGVLSHKTVAEKPTGRPDVLWGFDPYRFDHEAMAHAVRQVLKGNFGLVVDGVVANEPEPVAPPPTRTMLHPCRPNPFNPSTTVMFETAKPGMVSLRVVDVRGRHVKTLVDEAKGMGVFEATWKGRDDAGRAMPAGAYFVQMICGDVRETRRMVLLK